MKYRNTNCIRVYTSSGMMLGILLLLRAGTLNAQTDATAFVYQKPLFDFDYKAPVFKQEGGQASNKNRFLRAVVLTGYREGVKPISGILNWEIYTDPTTGTKKIAMYNLSIVDMLNSSTVDPNKVILEVKDPSKYIYKPEYGDKETWMRKNARCYECVMPNSFVVKESPGGLFYQQELQRILGVKAARETRMVKVLVLVRTSDVDKIKSKGVNTGANGTMDERGNFKTNLIGNVATPLAKTGYPPMIDETGYTGAIDMDLNISNWKDLGEVRKALQRYDLDLKEDTREVKDVLVVTEIKK